MAKILIIDKQATLTDLMGDWLSLNHYEVFNATSSDDAIKLAGNSNPDLILLDAQMDGVEIGRRLRKKRETHLIPILLITESQPPLAHMERLQSGANEVISKPLVLESLIRQMEVYLPSSEITQEERSYLAILYETLALPDCDLVWFLTTEGGSKRLTSREMLAADESVIDYFRGFSGGHSISAGEASPFLRETLVRGTALLNLAPTDFVNGKKSGFSTAFTSADINLLSVFPMRSGQVTSGLLILGTSVPIGPETMPLQQAILLILERLEHFLDREHLIDRLQHVESEFEQRSAFFRTLIDTMGDGLLVYGVDGLVRFVNRQLLLMIGKKAEDIAGKPISEFFHPDDRDRINSIMSPGGTVGTSLFELRLLSGEESSLPVLAVRGGLKLPGTDGDPQQVMVLTDLSIQKSQATVLTRQTRRLAVLNRAASLINSSLSLEEIIRQLLSEVRNALAVNSAFMFLKGDDKTTLICRGALGPDAEKIKGNALPIAGSVVGEVFIDDLPIMLSNAYEDRRLFHGQEEDFTEKTETFAAVPVRLDRRPIGVISVANKKEGFFDNEDLEILESLARSAATAIQNAQHFEDVRRNINELELLLKASEAASSTLSIQEVVSTVAKLLMDTLSAKWCVISAWDKETQELSRLTALADLGYGKGQSYSGEVYKLTRDVLEAGEPLTATEDSLVLDPGRREMMLKGGLHSLVIIPLKLKGTVVGVAELYHTGQTHNFSLHDIDRTSMTLEDWQENVSVDTPFADESQVRQLAANLRKMAGAEWCVIRGYDPTKVENQVVTLYRLGQVVVDGKVEPFHPDKHSILYRAITEQDKQLINIGEDYLMPEDANSFRHLKDGTVLIVPLIAHGEPIGVIQLATGDSTRSFSDHDQSLAQGIAGVVGNALENVSLYDNLSRHTVQLEVAYDELRQIDKIKNELIQNVSHEMRTPLTTIIGYANLLRGNGLGSLNEQQIAAVDDIADKGESLAGLIDSFLELNELEPKSLDREAVSLTEIIELAIQSTDSENENTIIFSATEDFPPINGDKERLFKVFEQLLSNAIKFSPAGNEIRLAIHDEGKMLRTTITDQGIGISPSEHEKIWRRFYQVDGSATRTYGGTGLGLSLVKEITENHGGQVQVESVLGEGTTFTVILPKFAEGDR